MEQLIFIGIILLFSILEAVARKGKQGEGSEQLPGEIPPQPRPRPRPSPSREEREGGERGRRAPPSRVPPAYDQDPSYDESVEERPARARSGSEGLIPADVWDEIQRMARGETAEAPAPRTPPRPRPAPPPKPAPPPVPSRTRPAPSPARRTPRDRSPEAAPVEVVARRVPPPEAELEGTPDHAIHLTHASYGTPVGGRLTGFAEGAVIPRTSREVGEVRALLAGGPSRLRQAVILQELLGPPLSLRDDPAGDDR